MQLYRVIYFQILRHWRGYVHRQLPASTVDIQQGARSYCSHSRDQSRPAQAKRRKFLTPSEFVRCYILATFNMISGAVAKSVEGRPRVREIDSLVPSRVKPMTCKIYTCHFLAWHLTLIG